MTIDPSVSESNLRNSVKKYFVDSLETAQGVKVIFDRTITSALTDASNIDAFLVINFGSLVRDKLASHLLEINCCTKEDVEGWKLAQLSDKVLGTLIDTEMSDTIRRIPLYNTEIAGHWEQIGSLYVSAVYEGKEQFIADKTRYKSITVDLQWAMKI